MKILVLAAHPALERSVVNIALRRAVARDKSIQVHDLYDSYPDFQIDVAEEQEKILSHDLIVFQHPFYWY